MTNDELSAIDALLSHAKQPLPYELAKALRDQLASNAAEAVRVNKKLADLQRRAADSWCADMDVW